MKLKTIFITFVSVMIVASFALPGFCEEKKPKVRSGSIGKTLIDNYQIGIGDVLEITTWKEPDFSRGNVMVRLDGFISFPVLDDFPAAGLSPMELKYNLEQAIKNVSRDYDATIYIVEIGPSP